ncbi:hypothetical protein CGRA01v4_05754 [Colletotrichum graminicola]|nr:hypothetical protein CGRA01v4_05754 [Colletotrichum graminicola]
MVIRFLFFASLSTHLFLPCPPFSKHKISRMRAIQLLPSPPAPCPPFPVSRR